MELNEAFEILVNKIINREKFYSLHGKIKSVNESERTCVVTPIGDEADVEDVRLQGAISSKNGFVLIPSVDSVVSITFVNDTNAFISLCTKIDKILIDTDLVQFNGGDNGGLINIEDLLSEMNAIKSDINDLKLIFLTSWTPVSQDGGAALKVAAATWAAETLKDTKKNQIEDTKVTH